MFYDNMATPHRRPRDKGGTDLRDSAAKSFESSNQTMAMFLGGTPKSWMTGHQIANALPPLSAHTHTHSRPNPTRQGTIAQARTGGSGPQLAGEGTAATAVAAVTAVTTADAVRHDYAAIATSGSVASSSPLGVATNATAPTVILKSTPEKLDTVLPSPAPSDEPRQASVHIIDLEEEEPEPPANEQTESVGGEVLTETRLIDLAAKYGGVDELEKRLSNAEPRNSAADAANNGEILPGPEDASCSGNVGPTEQYEAQLSNEIYQGPLVAPERQTQSALSASMDGRPIVLPRLAMRVPSSAVVTAFRTQITHRMDAIRSTEHARRTVEIPRLGLLEDACSVYDFFYLIMHQIFCLGTIPNLANPSGFHRLAHDYKDGLVLLTHLLLSNDQLADDASTWFSTFPLPLNVLLKQWPSLRATYEKVLQCLNKLPREWLSLSSHCHQRYYPPLVDEMISMLGVTSTILQRVICRAVLRDVWPGPQDECYNEVEKLFHQNQQEVRLRISFNDTAQAATTETILLYNQRLAMRYQQLWGQHRSHLNVMVQQQQDLASQQPGSPMHIRTPMPPPQQMNIDSPTLTRPGGYHNISQSMYPAPVSRLPIPLVIDTQSISQTPTNFDITPTVPSSSFSGVSVQASPVTAAARSPSSQSSPLSGVFQTNGQMPHRRRRPPRRDFTVPAVAHIPSPRSATRNPSSVYNIRRPSGSISSQVSAHSPLQPFLARQWEPQSAPVNPYQSHVVSPVTAHFRHSPTASPTNQNMPQQFGSFIPSQTQSQSRSGLTYMTPPTPHYPHHTQAVAQPPLPMPMPNATPVPQSPAPPLFPPSGHVRSSRDPPNPVLTTLHQVHVRSPNLTAAAAEGRADNTITYFSFVRQLAVMPERLTGGNRHFRWTFEVDTEDFQLLAQTSSGAGGSSPAIIVRAGSRIFRVRCVKVSDPNDISESEWVVAETFWPNGIAILLNGVALELRKKVHHGKDLAANITQHMREGRNDISVAITRPSQDDAATYAIGIETVEITDSDQIHATIPRLAAEDALLRIAERTASIDPDIEIVNSTVIVDITDPFTSCMWELPVRGKTCRHNQCFDLNVFLQTRGSKPGYTSAPEQFKCPICASDARPPMLLVDLFFVKIREELQQMNRLDVKAIILDDHGSWKIKEEELSGESGDGTGTGGPTLPGGQPSEIREGRASVGQESEVIELDDD